MVRLCSVVSGCDAGALAGRINLLQPVLPLLMMLFSYMVTIAAYPLLSLLLAFIQNHMIQDEE